MRIADAIRKPPVTLECHRTITEAAQLMDEQAVGAVIVTDQDRPIGIVTDRDLVLRGLAHRLSAEARIDSVMSTDLATLPPDAEVREALPIFRSQAVRRIPVVADDRAIGMVTIDDLFVDLVADLSDLVRPVTGQVIFGHPEVEVPVKS